MRELVGYHGTKSSNVSDIISSNHWLGHGIYFFTDFELAEWWAKTKVEKHNKKYHTKDKASVIKAEIQADKIVDLDSEEIV